MKSGIIILGHGSRSENAQQVFEEIVTLVSEKLNYGTVKGAAMEFASPTLEEVAAGLVEDGLERIIIVPLFIYPGVHIKRDIPAMIDRLKEEYPEIRFVQGSHIGAEEKLAEIMADRVQQAAENSVRNWNN